MKINNELKKALKEINWKVSSKGLSNEAAEILQDFVDWNIISSQNVLNEKFVEKHIDQIDFSALSWNIPRLYDISFIEKFKDKLNWTIISYNIAARYAYDEEKCKEILDKYSDKIDWIMLTTNIDYTFLTKEFVDRYKDNLDFDMIFRFNNNCNDTTRKNLLLIVHNIYDAQPISYKSSLQDYTWEEIDAIVKEGKHKELFNIGDTKIFRLGDEILEAQIADFDHDNLSNGSGKAGISFIIKDCMDTKHNMNLYSTNSGGWHNSGMRRYLNNDIYDKLPSDLQSVIKPVNKITSIGYTSSTLETTSDKLWLMSEKEAFGTSRFSVDGEGKQYPIFTNNDSRIKKVNGVNYDYWLRSPYVSGSTDFCGVYSDGSLYSYGNASYSIGVAFGFCI